MNTLTFAQKQKTYDNTMRILIKKALYSKLEFRQWVFPNIPKDYAVNPDLIKEVRKEIATRSDPDSQDIANTIYRKHT